MVGLNPKIMRISRGFNFMISSKTFFSRGFIFAVEVIALLEKVLHVSFQISCQFGRSKMNGSRKIQSC